MTTVTLLICDLADQLASAEDAGFARAIHTLQSSHNITDRERWEMMQEHRSMHGLRAKLYVAQLTKPQGQVA